MSQLTLGQLSTNGHSNSSQVFIEMMIEHQLSVDWDAYQVLIEHRPSIHQDDDWASTECCSRCLSSVTEHWSSINEDDDWTLTEYWVLLEMSINLIEAINWHLTAHSISDPRNCLLQWGSPLMVLNLIACLDFHKLNDVFTWIQRTQHKAFEGHFLEPQCW